MAAQRPRSPTSEASMWRISENCVLAVSTDRQIPLGASHPCQNVMFVGNNGRRLRMGVGGNGTDQEDFTRRRFRAVVNYKDSKPGPEMIVTKESNDCHLTKYRSLSYPRFLASSKLVVLAGTRSGSAISEPTEVCQRWLVRLQARQASLDQL